jgi:predicted transcriptional regulator
LAYFFAHPEAKHYLREIAGMLGIDPGNLSRELRKLETDGLFQSKKRGNQKCFFLNPSYPYYNEVKKLIEDSAADGSLPHSA